MVYESARAIIWPNPLEIKLVLKMYESILLPIHSQSTNNQKTQEAINLSKNKVSYINILSTEENPFNSAQAKKAISYAVTLVSEVIHQNNLICNVLYRPGIAEFVICKIANDLKVDLIVMETKGIDLLKNSQSTTSKVLEIAPCPVLIIP